MIARLCFFAYGLVAYVAFLVVMAYTVGFVGNFGVPTTLDSAPHGSPASALLVDLALLGLFGVQHSVMARPGFKRAWTRIVPLPIERSTYVLSSSLALALVLWQWRPIGGVIWSIDNPTVRAALIACSAFGWGLVFVSTFLIHHFDLFGLRQVWLHLIRRPYTSLRFRTPGPYRLVRHPLYVGFLLAFWMTPTMTAAHLVFALGTTAYILIAVRFEERDLVRELGPEYDAYRRKVPMLIPFTKRLAHPGQRLAGSGTAEPM